MSADGAGGPPASSWTRVRTALLIEHYHAGLSAAASAHLLGATSRNAVISKRRRLGLVATIEIGRTLAVADDVVRRPKPKIHWARLFRGPPPLPTEPLPRMDERLPCDARPTTLVGRQRGRCAWPLGPAEEPGDYRTLFCGARVEACGVYCATHRARAYCREV
jgi:hypothetical protein